MGGPCAYVLDADAVHVDAEGGRRDLIDSVFELISGTNTK